VLAVGLVRKLFPVRLPPPCTQASAVVIAHEELAAADPAFTLSFLAHSMLFVNNLAFNGNEEQCARLLPAVCSGAKIGGACVGVWGEVVACHAPRAAGEAVC
jgi:alkylation response protein AidB-like acyl-CoA dehydrogenase